MPRTLAFAAVPVLTAALAAPFAAAPVQPEPRKTTWPMYGGTPGRNMVNLTDRLPDLPAKGPDWEKKDEVKKWRAEWCLWTADLGSRCFAQPVVAGERVFVGTNNERPRNPRDVARNADGEEEPVDRGVLMCFDRRTGAFLWQAVHDKLESGVVNDWPKEGLVSIPTVEGDRVYYVTNRCTVVCADANGMADGNQGFRGEKYQTGTDADVLWEYDMRAELGVFPHNMSTGCPLIVGDLLFTTTSNGVDEGHVHIPAPDAPSFVALNKHTGKLVWKDASPGKDIMHGQWAAAAYAAEPVPQVIVPQGDGWLRAFDPPTGKLLWKFEGNPKGAVYEIGATGNKTDFIAAPVVHDGRVYIGNGQDPEHTDGIGSLWCIDLHKAVAGGAKNPDRDVSPDLLVRMEKGPNGVPKAVTRPNPDSALAWHFGGEETRKWAVRDYRFGRTLGAACVVDDVLYVTELPGYVHCFNARTGEHYWQYDTKSTIWPAAFFVDGKVLVANESGELFVFRHDPKPEAIDELGFRAANQKEARQLRAAKRKEVEQKYLLSRIEFDAPIRGTPSVAGGVLYLATETTLYAFGKR